MFDFSGDEWLFFLAAAIMAVVGAFKWYSAVTRVGALRFPQRQRLVLGAAPAVCLLVLWVVLRNWADPVFVAGHLDYELLFLAGGAAWLGLALKGFPMFGVSPRDDAIERRNPAAAAAVVGGMLGVTLAYAYSNVGNGPTIWTTLVPAVVATVTLLLLWGLLELAGPVGEAVAIDRDVAAGVRLAAFLVAAGAVLGRAMAGDWYTWWGTFESFLDDGWPALGLVALAAAMNRLLRPTPERPAPSVVAAGVIPAAVLLVVAAAHLVYLGAPEVLPPGAYPMSVEQ
jgi:uncharacterized membrane protein YjfL (UPF0719 family)